MYSEGVQYQLHTYVVLVLVRVYVLGDSVFLLEFNSADDYAMIKEGKKYKVYGYWFRLPFMSWFPKIYKYKEV